MANIPVAYNLQAATVAGFVSVCLLHVCQANGIIIPPDVADALPGVLAIIVAHVSDVISGENHPPKPPVA